MTPSPSAAGTIRLTREPGPWRDRLRAYSILVDSQVVGEIRRKQTLDPPVEPGAHSVKMAIDWARSPTISVEVGPGQTVDLRCAPNRTRPLLVGVTVGRGKYVRLWQDGDGEDLGVPWLPFLTFGLLLVALGFATAYGRTVEAALIALFALESASLIVAWAIARRRR